MTTTNTRCRCVLLGVECPQRADLECPRCDMPICRACFADHHLCEPGEVVPTTEHVHAGDRELVPA